MRPIASILLTAALLAIPMYAPAESTADLVAKLGGDDWAARQAAEDALVVQGTAVLDELNTTLAATNDVELHERIASAIARIGREQFTNATPVTIDKSFDHPIDALRAVANVMGLSVVAESPKAADLIEVAKPVSLKCSNTPWLEALLNCAADSGVAVRLSGERIIVLERPALQGRPRMVVFGAIALVADSARKSETIDLATDRHNTGTYLSMSLFTEPKLRLANGSAVLSIKTLNDEHDRSLMKKSIKLPLSHLPDGRWNAPITLLLPDPPPTRIAKLEAELLANVVTSTDELRVDDLTSLPLDMQTAAGPVGVKSVSQVNGNWSIVIHVPQSRITTGVFGASSLRAWQFGDPDLLKITDSHGRRLITGVPTMAVSDDLEMTMPITLASPDDSPKAVLIRMPARTREMRTPLTLSDLPLP